GSPAANRAAGRGSFAVFAAQDDTGVAAMNITRDEARRIAELAHLEFDDASLDRLAGEMTKILRYIDRLRDAGEAPAGTPALQILRDDVARPGIARAGIERNAPELDRGFFVVPKVIE
ncbi:MAG TPA: Asp-tRNA(Asn)/Glu-tRNA(Gln) amidotransferase subunit GatC, partial [Thermoanaerobaculia bacterium]|nr:Asp-tRNA(Asn)/Glu-tRNA(Gln) amidotransferase subunit GatC [Thermoanaerobaculia bacterium]